MLLLCAAPYLWLSLPPAALAHTDIDECAACGANTVITSTQTACVNQLGVATAQDCSCAPGYVTDPLNTDATKTVCVGE
jgi:hypothetical protein